MSQSFQREEFLFHQAAQFATAEDQQKYLESECAGDDALKQRVLQLLEPVNLRALSLGSRLRL